MIFDEHFLMELRSTGVNSQNLKKMILLVAVKSAELEKELKNGSDNTKKQAQSAGKVDSAG
jgi:hypothetical protein